VSETISLACSLSSQKENVVALALTWNGESPSARSVGSQNVRSTPVSLGRDPPIRTDADRLGDILLAMAKIGERAAGGVDAFEHDEMLQGPHELSRCRP
jgi:hypothetical protein